MIKLLTAAKAIAPSTALQRPIRKLNPSTNFAAEAKTITFITKANRPESNPSVSRFGRKKTAFRIGKIKTFKIPKTAIVRPFRSS